MDSAQSRNDAPAWLIALLFVLFLLFRWQKAKKTGERIYADPKSQADQLRMEISRLKKENELLKSYSVIQDAEAHAARIIEAERKAEDITGE